MKHLFIIAATLTLAAPVAAQAEAATQLTPRSYLAASQCVAFAELPQLQGDTFDISGLKQAVDEASVGADLTMTARRNARDVVRIGARAGEQERSVQTLRDRRDDACADFVSTGLVQAAPTTPAS